MGWLGSFIGCVQMGLAFIGVRVVFVLCFALVHLASTLLLPMASSAFNWGFLAGEALVPMGGAPVALSAWHDTEISLSRSECAETGLLGRSPTTSVGHVWTDRRCGERGQDHGGKHMSLHVCHS